MKTLTIDADAYARLVDSHGRLVGALGDLFEHCAMIHSRWGEGSNMYEAKAAIEHAEQALAAAKRVGAGR